MSELDLPKILKLEEDLNSRFAEIPFGNSRFQNENFVINAQYTPARAYRAIGLALSARLRGLKEALFNFKREQIGIEELKFELSGEIQNQFDHSRKELDLQEKQSNISYLEKLVKDSAYEVEILSAALKKFPQYTREQFESEEPMHYARHLQLQAAGVQGAHESLFQMGLGTQEIASKVFGSPEFKLITELLDKDQLLLGKTLDSGPSSQYIPVAP